MTKRSTVVLAAACAAVALAAATACGGGGGAATATRAPAGATAGAATPAPASATIPAAAASATHFGIAGLVPAHFPGSTADDWKAFYASIPSLGGWLGAYFAYDPAHGIPPAAASQLEGGAQLGFESLANIGFNHDAAGQYQSSVDFTSGAQVRAYTAALVALAGATHPPFLGLGNEVNRYWEQDPAGYDAFARAVPGIVQAIHAASPSTQVFATFQYEFVLGAGRLSPVPGGRRPEWGLVEALAPSLDLVGFTTYPFFDYASPADVPADYFSRALAHTAGRPVGFTEIGWPAAPLAPAPASDLGGSPDEQAAFVQRLPALFAGVHPAFALWLDEFDTPAAGPTFESTGLATRDGEPRPALRAWRQVATAR